MALKDWKKEKSYLDIIVYKWVKIDTIGSYRVLYLTIEKYPQDENYYIWLHENPSGSNETIGYAKSKSEALKFANKYMKEGF